MTDWKAFLVQAVTSVIASGLILSGFNIFYNDVYNKPNLSVQHLLKDNMISANITNSGRVPANHLNLIVQTPSNITSYKVFATDNVTSNRTDSQSLKISMPRLVQGDGSLITIKTLLAQNADLNKFPKYTIFATFDDGSWKYILQKPTSSIEILLHFLVDYGSILFLIFAGITLFTLLWFKRTRNIITRKFRPSWSLIEGIPFEDYVEQKQKDSRKWAIGCRNDVLIDLMKIHHGLESNPLDKKIFSSGLFSMAGDPNARLEREFTELENNKTLLKSGENVQDSNWSLVGIILKFMLFQHVPDLIIIDSLYSKIDKRTHLLQESSIDGEELKNLNLECLNLTKSALKDIDWNKYLLDIKQN